MEKGQYLGVSKVETKAIFVNFTVDENGKKHVSTTQVHVFNGALTNEELVSEANKLIAPDTGIVAVDSTSYGDELEQLASTNNGETAPEPVPTLD